MTASIINLSIEQGASYTLVVQWVSDDTDIPFNINGCKLRMQMRIAPKADLLFEGTTENGKLVIEDGPTGQFSINLLPTDTDHIQFTKVMYDVECEFIDGKVFRIMQGTIDIDPNITHDEVS